MVSDVSRSDGSLLVMRLLIISGMPHHRRDGVVVGWGPTVHEIDHLTEIFEEVRHVGLLHPGEAPTSALPYRSPRVTFIPAPPAGGNRLAEIARGASVVMTVLQLSVMASRAISRKRRGGVAAGEPGGQSKAPTPRDVGAHAASRTPSDH